MVNVWLLKFDVWNVIVARNKSVVQSVFMIVYVQLFECSFNFQNEILFLIFKTDLILVSH